MLQPIKTDCFRTSLIIGELPSYSFEIKKVEVTITIKEDSSNNVVTEKYFSYNKNEITFGELMGI